MTHNSLKPRFNARELKPNQRPPAARPIFLAVALWAGLLAHAPRTQALASNIPPTSSHTIPYLSSAVELGYEAGLKNILALTKPNEVQLQAGDESFAALAQYQPLFESSDPNDGILTIGTRIKQYKQEYNYLSTIYDRSQKPDFDQYMTVLILLSLANESAHREQHINGSLEDYVEYKNRDNTAAACTLYSLQQHVSDVLMIDNALRLETYFLGKGFASGIRALHLVLEKMEVKSAFDTMQKSLTNNDGAQLKAAMHALYLARLKANMSPRPECRDITTIRLDHRVYKRAIEPAKTPFAFAYSRKEGKAETHQSAPANQ